MVKNPSSNAGSGFDLLTGRSTQWGQPSPCTARRSARETERSPAAVTRESLRARVKAV